MGNIIASEVLEDIVWHYKISRHTSYWYPRCRYQIYISEGTGNKWRLGHYGFYDSYDSALKNFSLKYPHEIDNLIIFNDKLKLYFEKRKLKEALVKIEKEIQEFDITEQEELLIGYESVHELQNQKI